MAKKQGPSSMLIDMRTSFNVLTFVADVHTACIRPFTRTHQGIHGMGWAGFYAMLAIPAVAALGEMPGLLTYWYVWMAMVIYRRIKADKYQHSSYQGWPWCFRWCMNNELNMRAMEAGTMPMLAGIASAVFGPEVGTFICFGFFSFGYRYVIDSMTHAQRIKASRDARIEMHQAQDYVD
jgi:hypothetical protein